MAEHLITDGDVLLIRNLFRYVDHVFPSGVEFARAGEFTAQNRQTMLARGRTLLEYLGAPAPDWREGDEDTGTPYPPRTALPVLHVYEIQTKRMLDTGGKSLRAHCACQWNSGWHDFGNGVSEATALAQARADGAAHVNFMALAAAGPQQGAPRA